MINYIKYLLDFHKVFITTDNTGNLYYGGFIGTNERLVKIEYRWHNTVLFTKSF